MQDKHIIAKILALKKKGQFQTAAKNAPMPEAPNMHLQQIGPTGTTDIEHLSNIDPNDPFKKSMRFPRIGGLTSFTR